MSDYPHSWGPWQWDADGGYLFRYRNDGEDSDTMSIVHVLACVNACAGINPEAVPALLEACKAAYNADACDVDCGRDDGVWPQVAAAIAKARGDETPADES